MGYKLRILSPVHIGCGEQYSGLNFILDGNKVFVIEPETVTKLLGPKDGLTFARWLEKNADDIAQLNAKHREEKRKARNSDATKKLSRELRTQKQNFTLKKFFELNRMITMEQLKENSAYSIIALNGFYNDSEFCPFIKQMKKPYIPGTEIKGAIRTAILYCALQDNEEIQQWLEQSLNRMLVEAAQKRQGQVIATFQYYINTVKNQQSPDTRKKLKLVERVKKIASELQDKVFNSMTDRPDAKYDVMKFLNVGDSILIDIGTPLAVSYVEPFNIKNRFKVFYEYLQPELQIPLTSLTLESLRGSDEPRNTKLDKMRFSETHKKIVSGMDVILTKCYRFAADLLHEEIAYYQRHGKTEIVKHLQEIEKQNTPESPVLRIGKDEGYSSLTVGLAVKKLMPKLYENVLIHATKNKSYDSAHGGPLPKSRKIVYWNGKELTAGWVKLIPEALSPQQIFRQDEPTQHKLNAPIDPLSLQALQAKFSRGKR